ncbi:malonyl-CoA decarboxylase, partial [Corallococcus coralloides]|nr:malonyl-CoA decarboxylase [Corallococcus coralloides]
MNAASEWITRSVSRLRTEAPLADLDAAGTEGGGRPPAEAAPAPAPSKAPPPRSTSERMAATLRRANEALSPRALRRLLADLQAVAAPQSSEVEGGRQAEAVAAWYAEAKPEERRDMWLLMCEQFAPDATRFRT